jgi:hypothetical protein
MDPKLGLKTHHHYAPAHRHELSQVLEPISAARFSEFMASNHHTLSDGSPKSTDETGPAITSRVRNRFPSDESQNLVCLVCLNEVNRLIWPSPQGIGVMNAQRWLETAKISHRYGITKSLANRSAYSNEFVKKALGSLRQVDTKGQAWNPQAVALLGRGQ